MAHHESWVRAAWESLMDFVWNNKTHRILAYISIVLTLILLVEVFEVSLVGR